MNIKRIIVIVVVIIAAIWVYRKFGARLTASIPG